MEEQALEILPLACMLMNSFSAAEREFEQVLNIGQSFQITLGHTANINGSIGITLFSASADLINLSFSSGESNWLLWDGDPSTYSSAAYNPNTPLLFSLFVMIVTNIHILSLK